MTEQMLAEIEARVVRDRRSFEEGRTAGWYVNPPDDLTDREWLIARNRVLAEEAAGATLMRDAAYDKWDEYEAKQEERVRALEAQAALDGAVVEAARAYWEAKCRANDWDVSSAEHVDAIIEAQGLFDRLGLAICDADSAALAARDAGKGE